MKEALLWEKLEAGRVRCNLCAHRCPIQPGDLGICKVRRNDDGILMSLVYGRAVAANVDPIEKKPLFHFLPGTKSMSIATVGCNLSCRHCQNADISQAPRDWDRIVGSVLPPAEVVRRTRENGAASVSYTYTEPTIFFEYALDTARLAAKEGFRNVFVTNGYMTPEALDIIGGDLHAANVDLKAFTDDFYKKVCGARIEPVKENIARLKSDGVWVEVTTLLIPGYNDDVSELGALAEWLVSVDSDIPWHISRFHPTYRLTDARTTPVESIRRAREIGLAAGLKFVYTGNVWGDEGENTFCPDCRRRLIEREGFTVRSNALSDGACPDCGAKIPGVWR